MKFIYNSDWHVGGQFQNVSLFDDQQHVLNKLTEYIKY
ncbi:MAG: exonuclease SbcD [Cocleimonas sp.]|jgi:exonuclease SbcD